MSMEKAIASGKEHRKKYRGTKAFDCSCRNHGTCDYCKGNRLYKFNKKIQTQFNRMCSSGILFRSSVSGDRLWGSIPKYI